ncbi:hypothetical protein Taro_039146 [Colocasia esculenta]|uniref:Aminotransferase-like plant mobile domain-containing protein n=1 Tax=Colocasia esculenta TaxID=4460 RepID=A0A843WQP8_COLES|nr:hypothetical protein [Colocasia esculenta]
MHHATIQVEPCRRARCSPTVRKWAVTCSTLVGTDLLSLASARARPIKADIPSRAITSMEPRQTLWPCTSGLDLEMDLASQETYRRWPSPTHRTETRELPITDGYGVCGTDKYGVRGTDKYGVRETNGCANCIMPFKKNYLGRDNYSQKTCDGVIPRGIMMPALARPRITETNLSLLDSGYHVVATLDPEGLPSNGQVDRSCICRRNGTYYYMRKGGYPSHFPSDKELFSFIQQFIPPDMPASDPCLLAERRYLESAILRSRDNLLGTCVFSYPGFPLEFTALKRMPTAEDLDPFNRDLDCYTRSRKISPAIWSLQNCHKTATEIDVVPSHIFRYGAIEWLTGILHHYGEVLKMSGIYGAVEAALYDYPCYTGILRGLVERFSSQWNTFGTAEGETSIDLWSFHQISGLPISGLLYEEVVLDDLHSHRSNGSGRYIHPYSLRFLTKVWRDLARVGKKDGTSPSSSTVRVSQNAWLRYFYNEPFCFFESFSVEGRRLEEYQQLEVKKPSRGRFICALKDMGWNPRRLPDHTYLATYLVYWLSSFVVPHREEEYLRLGLIYPACLLAEGRQLALAPAALANIFHGLGSLSSHPSPRDRKA